MEGRSSVVTMLVVCCVKSDVKHVVLQITSALHTSIAPGSDSTSLMFMFLFGEKIITIYETGSWGVIL